MSHIPLGYRIEDGCAVIDHEAAEIVKRLFSEYNSGLGLNASAKMAGITVSHASISNILRNRRYLGDAFYPAIIDEDTFERAQVIRQERALRLGRVHVYIPEEKEEKELTFRLREKVTKKYDDPYAQAEYVYSLIETEEIHATDTK